MSTHLCSDREQTVEFGLGADDSFELWISGVSLLKKATCQYVHKDNFVFSHTLKAGVNTILLKILDYHGENGFLLSLRKQYPGIHVSLDRNSCLQNFQNDNYANGGHFTSAVKTAYKPPYITNLQLTDADGTSVLSEMNTIGGDRLVIQGNNFGPISDKISVNYGPSNAPFQYLAENCYVTQVDVEIQCTTARGVNGGHAVTVTVGSQKSQPSTVTISYGAPIISGISPDIETGVELFKLQTRGGEKIIINGRNFPSQIGETKVVVTYGSNNGDRFFAKDCVILSPGTSMACLTTEGSGSGHNWYITVGNMPAANYFADATAYDKPEITSLRGPGVRNANTRGMEVMFIHGHTFGKEINMTYGPTAAEYVATDCEIFVRHEIVRCLSFGNKHLFRITIDSLVIRPLYRRVWLYGQPVLNDVAGAGSRNALSSGGEPVRLLGRILALCLSVSCYSYLQIHRFI